MNITQVQPSTKGKNTKGTFYMREIKKKLTRSEPDKIQSVPELNFPSPYNLLIIKSHAHTFRKGK